MTLCAVQTPAGEDAKGLIDDLFDRWGLVNPDHVLMRRALVTLDSDHLPCHLIIGLILSDVPANPLPERQLPTVVSPDTEQVCEAKSPEVDVFGRLEQCINQLLPF